MSVQGGDDVFPLDSEGPVLTGFQLFLNKR